MSIISDTILSSNLISALHLPKISIITVNYNSGRTLENSILSVIEQQYSNIEYIIIDGSSTDNSVNILQKYNNHISYWVSEKDRGIYDAMNKAIKKVTGEWIFFLGADDKLAPHILTTIHHYLMDRSSCVIFGNIIYSNGQVVKSTLTNKIYLHNTVHHQSAFYNANLFDNFEYKNGLKIISDYELNLLIKSQGLKYKYVDEIIATCNYGGASRNIKLFLTETNIIRSQYTSALQNYCFSCCLYVKAYLGLLLKS